MLIYDQVLKSISFIHFNLSPPRLESRVSAFLFKKTFEVQMVELKEMVGNAASSIKTVSSNFKLAKMLEIILNIGNFLNFETYAGNAFGFGMDSLLKLRVCGEGRGGNGG